MFQVARSLSMKTTSAPRKRTGLTEPMKVRVEATTTSPGATPERCRARCMAAVPLERARQCGRPVYSLKAASKASTCGPKGAM